MRVLAGCLPIPGHLGPNLALAEALRDRGHTVMIYSGSSARAAVERRGLAFAAFDPRMDSHLSRMIFPPPGASGAATAGERVSALFQVKHLRQTLKAWLLGTVPYQVSDLTALCAAFAPDVLVSDVTLLGPTLILKDTIPVPVASFCVIPECPIPGPGAPPWGRGIPPATTLLDRLRVAAERRVIDWMMADVRVAADALRRANGLLPLSGRLAEEYGRVPLFMVTGAPEFDYARTDLPACVRYVGPCTLGDEEVPPPSWLSDLRPAPPVVHVTEGTVHTEAPTVLRAAAAGLGGGPFQVIMTTGGHRRPEDLNLRSASNVRVEPFVSHRHLLPRTDVLVTTGSAGTVTRALMTGVPIVIVPVGWEHPETAQRIVETHVGVRLPPRHCTPRRLRAAVERVLRDPAYRANARRIGDGLARQGGTARAADLLEEVTPPGAASLSPPPAEYAQNPRAEQ